MTAVQMIRFQAVLLMSKTCSYLLVIIFSLRQQMQQLNALGLMYRQKHTACHLDVGLHTYCSAALLTEHVVLPTINVSAPLICRLQKKKKIRNTLQACACTA